MPRGQDEVSLGPKSIRTSLQTLSKKGIFDLLPGPILLLNRDPDDVFLDPHPGGGPLVDPPKELLVKLLVPAAASALTEPLTTFELVGAAGWARASSPARSASVLRFVGGSGTIAQGSISHQSTQLREILARSYVRFEGLCLSMCPMDGGAMIPVCVRALISLSVASLRPRPSMAGILLGARS